jgi:hypothetical protein
MIYKVSYVVLGGHHSGAIMNQAHPPKVGDRIEIGRETFEILEAREMMAGRNEFEFWHATVRPVKLEETAAKQA